MVSTIRFVSVAELHTNMTGQQCDGVTGWCQEVRTRFNGRVNLRQRMGHATDAIHRRMDELLKDESAGSISERVALRKALTTLADLQKITYARRPSGSVRRERGQAISP